MSTDPKKAKLAWHCRRGMLELDLLLARFMENYFDHLTDDQFELFETLLGHSDPELYGWLTAFEQPANKEIASFVNLIRLHSKP